MIFRGSDTMASLPSIKGCVGIRKVVAIAVRYHEAGLFENGYTAVLVQGVSDTDSLKWVLKDEFIPSVIK